MVYSSIKQNNSKCVKWITEFLKLNKARCYRTKNKIDTDIVEDYNIFQ